MKSRNFCFLFLGKGGGRNFTSSSICVNKTAGEVTQVLETFGLDLSQAATEFFVQKTPLALIVLCPGSKSELQCVECFEEQTSKITVLQCNDDFCFLGAATAAEVLSIDVFQTNSIVGIKLAHRKTSGLSVLLTPKSTYFTHSPSFVGQRWGKVLGQQWQEASTIYIL